MAVKRVYRNLVIQSSRTLLRCPGATVVSLLQGLAVALLPAVTAILTAFVAYGRWKLAPL
jgi:hypothetical protein